MPSSYAPSPRATRKAEKMQALWSWPAERLPDAVWVDAPCQAHAEVHYIQLLGYAP